MVWQVAHGDTPDNVRNNPALKGLDIPRTGAPTAASGTLVTKSLVIAGEPGFNTTANGRGALLRAYDKATGADAGAVYMPAPQTGSPMTYMRNGKQYIVVASVVRGTAPSCSPSDCRRDACGNGRRTVVVARAALALTVDREVDS